MSKSDKDTYVGSPTIMHGKESMAEFRKNPATWGLVDPFNTPIMGSISDEHKKGIDRAQSKLLSILERASTNENPLSQHQMSNVVAATFELADAYEEAFESVGSPHVGTVKGRAINDLKAMELGLTHRNTSTSVETDDPIARRSGNKDHAGIKPHFSRGIGE